MSGEDPPYMIRFPPPPPPRLRYSFRQYPCKTVKHLLCGLAPVVTLKTAGSS